MKKEVFKITVESKCKDQYEPHHLNSARHFEVYTTRALLFRSLEALENHVTKLYPLPSDATLLSETTV